MVYQYFHYFLCVQYVSLWYDILLIVIAPSCILDVSLSHYTGCSRLVHRHKPDQVGQIICLVIKTNMSYAMIVDLKKMLVFCVLCTSKYNFPIDFCRQRRCWNHPPPPLVMIAHQDPKRQMITTQELVSDRFCWRSSFEFLWVPVFFQIDQKWPCDL